MFEFDDTLAVGAKIKVVGVGGGGSNAVETMIRQGLNGVEFIVSNTDRQALEASTAPHRIQLGAGLTKGLGAGANPEVGRNAALEDHAKIAQFLEAADMVFITAGMGGGTGTGAAPVMAQIAKDLGSLTVGVVTKPFHFEGKKRMRQAEEGIKQLRQTVDTLIVIPNQRLLTIATEQMPLLETFKKCDEVLLHAVQGISDLINIRGLINLDFADIRTIMTNKGMALMGTGIGSGENRAVQAATAAISSPLLEDISIEGATGIIINITGDPSLSLYEVNEASTLIQQAAHEDAEIIFGAVIDEAMKDNVRVTVIASGFKKDERISQVIQKPPSPPSPYEEVIAVRTASPKHPDAYGSEPRIVIRGHEQESPKPKDPVSKTSSPKESAKQRPIRDMGQIEVDEDQYDIPTFIRRQTEID